MEEPLLREHKAREAAALDALAGQRHGSDPGATPEDEARARAALDALAGQRRGNDPGATPEDEAHARAALDALAGQRHGREPSATPEESALGQEIIEDTDVPLDAEPPLRVEEKLAKKEPPLDNKSEDMLEKTNPLREEIVEETDGALEADRKPPLRGEKRAKKEPPLNTEDMLPRQDIAKKSKEEEGTDRTDGPLDEHAGWWRWRWRRASSASGPHTLKRPKQRLRAPISARQPMLPLYAENEKQLMDKREVLYTLALATPVAILTAAAGLEVFDGPWALVAGASAGVWILAASGMVLNQYGVFDLERLAARHLGRLGVLGAGVLFGIFTYRAFFPLESWALWLLLGIAALALGLPWVLSCIRGDDDVISASTKSSGDAAGRVGKLEMRRGDPARRWTI